jgi:hypothetical protein
MNGWKWLAAMHRSWVLWLALKTNINMSQLQRDQVS